MSIRNTQVFQFGVKLQVEGVKAASNTRAVRDKQCRYVRNDEENANTLVVMPKRRPTSDLPEKIGFVGKCSA